MQKILMDGNVLNVVPLTQVGFLEATLNVLSAGKSERAVNYDILQGN